MWYKDGTYMDVTPYEAECYGMDPELDRTEQLDRYGNPVITDDAEAQGPTGPVGVTP